MTDQNLIEFLNATTRKGKLSLSDAAITVRGYLTYFTLLLPSQSVVEDTIALLDRHRLSVWDARILAICDAHGCTHLLSEDMQDGGQYGGVRVINPFNPSNAGTIAQLLV